MRCLPETELLELSWPRLCLAELQFFDSVQPREMWKSLLQQFNQQRWNTSDVRRALRCYIKRTASFPKTESLFVSFQPTAMGRKVLSSTIGRWLKACIVKTYELKARPVPRRIMAHSTRSAATTAAWATQAPIEDICRAAT